MTFPGNAGYRLPDEYGRMPAQQPGQPDQPGYGQPGKPGFWSQGQPGYGKPDDIGRLPNQPGYGQFGPSSEQMQRRGKDEALFLFVALGTYIISLTMYM